MALHAIANVGGREMGEALGPDVFRLLISPYYFSIEMSDNSTSKAFVKKKAALTLLRLYRKHPAILQPEWADRILSLLDDADMGVTLSVTHLLLALLQDYPEDYRGCYPKAVRRLKQVFFSFSRDD
jgi:AP-2 complex subunit alpha